MSLKKYKLFGTLFFTAFLSYSQGSTCFNIEPFCSDTGVNFSNTTGVSSAESGPSYGCLSSTPNPAWFFIRIGSDGNLNLVIEQNTALDFTGTGLDVDFISWGPFSQSEIDAGVCNNLTTSNTVACSYSPSAIENFNITSATSGDYYIVLITNFDGAPGFIKMDLLTSSSGTTDCAIVNDVTYCEGETMSFNATQANASSYIWKKEGIPIAFTGAILSGIPASINTVYNAEVYNANGDLIFDRQFNVMVTPPPFSGADVTLANLCEGDASLQDLFTPLGGADLGGVWTETSTIVSGISINNINTNDTTVDFSTAVFGTYTFDYEVAAKGPCIPFGSSISTVTITISKPPNAGFSSVLADICIGQSNFQDLFSDLGNADTGGLWTETSTVNSGIPIGTVIANASSVDFNSVLAGTYTFQYEVFAPAGNPCPSDLKTVTITVNPLPIINTGPFILEQCDDDFDGFNAFNLSEIDAEIVTNITNETFTYYESLADAEAGTNFISNFISYPNQIVNTDNTVWVRIEDANSCYNTTQITLVVKPSAIPTTFLRTFSECDDGSNTRDGIATFNFSSVTAEVQAMFPTAIDVFYYKNQADATSEINEITTPNNYQNNGSSNLQEIWVRADSQLGNDCLGNGHHITLIVEALPFANKPTDLTECDDDQDGFFPFDTSLVESEILSGQNLTDVTISYYNEDGTFIGNSLPNPFLTTSQTIDIEVSNNVTNDIDGSCSETTTMTFIVDILPINNTVVISPICDDDPNDGMLITTFNTSFIETTMGAQSDMVIEYFDETFNPLRDIDGNLISRPFPNSFRTTSQTITVIVSNPINVSCPIENTIDFIVNPLPEFDLTEESLVCENYLPHEISVENPVENDYIYEWFNSNGVSIGNDQTLIITNTDDITVAGVNYSVTATNPTTFCERTKSLRVWKSSIATITDADIVTVEFSSPENSIEVLTANLGSGDYEFALEHPNDSRYYQDDTLFTGLVGGIYTLLVRDKNGCGVASIEVVLIDYPKFLTPNNDGYNDTWQILGADSAKYTVSPIEIYDRYGKLVTIINATDIGWDGTYNGSALPSGGFWFALQLTDHLGNTKLHRGNFSLVRR